VRIFPIYVPRPDCFTSEMGRQKAEEIRGADTHAPRKRTGDTAG